MESLPTNATHLLQIIVGKAKPLRETQAMHPLHRAGAVAWVDELIVGRDCIVVLGSGKADPAGPHVFVLFGCVLERIGRLVAGSVRHLLASFDVEI